VKFNLIVTYILKTGPIITLLLIEPLQQILNSYLFHIYVENMSDKIFIPMNLHHIKYIPMIALSHCNVFMLCRLNTIIPS